VFSSLVLQVSLSSPYSIIFTVPLLWIHRSCFHLTVWIFYARSIISPCFIWWFCWFWIVGLFQNVVFVCFDLDLIKGSEFRSDHVIIDWLMMFFVYYDVVGVKFVYQWSIFDDCIWILM
jgi:hypothetical protein